MKSELRNLPGVDKLLSESRIKQLLNAYPHNLIVDIIRQQLEKERHLITLGKSFSSTDDLVESVCNRIQILTLLKPQRVINATGVIIHTNLGRAPLSDATIAAMEYASRGYSNLEFDLESGARGSRNTHIEDLLHQLTDAEASLVVNNNASAVLLGLTALAKRKEVIVPRGQAVEIGGSFRIPEIMKQSGAKLIEVGTTNCTYDQDYEQAIGPKTAALLRVHSSNFKIVGFTHSVSLEELVYLGNRYDIPVLDDLGSGCFLDTAHFGLDPEPTVQNSIAIGSAVAFFSGDKLLGGPQAGIIVGKKIYIDKLKKHPLARAMRIDKVRIAGLSATLVHYLRGEAIKEIPVWRMISMPIDEIEERAKTWAQALGESAQITEGESTVGGGSLPGATIPTKLVSIGNNARQKGNIAQKLSDILRAQRPPVIGRIKGNELLLDPRTVAPEEDKILIQLIQKAIGSL